MAFVELYVTGTGSNLNAGSTPANGATYSAAGDSDGVSVFTPSDGSTPAGSVNVGDVGSVFMTAGATVATFIGRVTAVAAGVNGAITFSITAKVGTFPAASAGAHTISCRVGGAWAGPAGAVIFPIGFIAGTLTDAGGNTPRVTFLGTFLPTVVMAHAAAGPVQFEGATATPGDGGRAIFDGGEPAASFNILTNSGANNTFENLTFQRNGSTGTGAAVGVLNTGSGTTFRRVIFNTIRSAGLTLGGGLAVECEFYACNVGNTVNQGGLTINSASGVARRCYSRSNVGSNNSGYQLNSTGGVLEHCIADGCQVGANLIGGGPYNLVHFDSYNNVSHGIQIGNTNVNCTFYVENGAHCNNGGTNIIGVGSGTKSGWVYNVAHGSGTAASAAQTAGLGTTKVIGGITLPANQTPWNAPATGDFRIVLPAVIGAGQGGYVQTAPKAGTTSQPTVGAAAQSMAVAAPSAGQIATALWQDLTASADFGVAGSIGALLKGGGSAPTAAQVATAVWQDLTASGDFGTAGSVGALLKASLPVAAAPTAAQVATALWQDLLASADFGTAGSVGALIKASLPVTGGGAPTAGQVATAVWQDLLTSADFTTPGSIGAKLLLLTVFAGGRLDVGAILGVPPPVDSTGMIQVDLEHMQGQPIQPLDLWAQQLPGAYPPGTAGNILGALIAGEVATLVARLAAVQVVTMPPAGPGQALRIVQGADYSAADGTAIPFSMAAGPNLTGALVFWELWPSTIKPAAPALSKQMTVLSAAACQLELTAAETGALKAGAYFYRAWATLIDTHHTPTLWSGQAVVAPY